MTPKVGSPSLPWFLFLSLLLLLVLVLTGAGPAFSAPGAQERAPAPPASPSDPLHELDAALRALTARVSPAVVQVLVSGYGAADETEDDTTVIARQHSVGSGVVVDPNGYIMTNAHVVQGAERIEVLLTKPRASSRSPSDFPSASEQTLLAAELVGTAEDFDLALLKIGAAALPVLPFADFRHVTQGQFVLAVGSPMGLENSVTHGVISSTAREPDPDSPLVFVQTDAPINPGNSGGALVDTDGYLVGINTFILSQAGGSEGLGFAIPAPMVKFVYDGLLAHGHVERRTVGLGIQIITPTLAKALGLGRPYGIIVADVTPDGPGAGAGMQIGDIILEADGQPVTSPAQLDTALYLQGLDVPIDVVVLRGKDRETLSLTPVEEKPAASSILDRIDPEHDRVAGLGILAVTLTPELQKEIGELRIHSGVIVLARELNGAGAEIELDRGDVIHAVNGIDIPDIDTLRRVISGFQAGDAVVLQVERSGGFEFLSFVMN